MAIKDNQSKQYRIYIKESKSWVDVNKEFYTNYYRDINSYRKRQQEARRYRRRADNMGKLGPRPAQQRPQVDI